MLKRVGFLTMTLAGALALFQPAVAQARDRDDYRYHDRDRHEQREWREHERRREPQRYGYYYDGYRCPR